MADNNENFRMTKSETEHFIEQLKKPQYWTKQTNDKKQLSIPLVSQRSELLAFAKEMQNIGFNAMDDAEKVVDIYLKANCG
ncbi:MAG: hypothetical protein ACPGRW_05975 [Flavobacteriaceae bacterium]